MAEATPAAPDAAEAAYKAQLAEMVKLSAEGMGISTEEKKPEEPEKKPDEEKPEEAPGDDSKETEESDDEKDTEGDDESEPKGDEKYTKALRRIQREEAKLLELKNQVLGRQKEFEQREQAIRKQEGEIVDFIKQLKASPWDTLLKYKLISESDAEYASKQLFYRSPEALKNPASKAEAERLQRERQLQLEAEETRQRLQRMEEERQRERQEMQQKQALDTYVSKLDTAAQEFKSKSSLLAKALEKNPTRTRQELFRIANDLSYAKQEFADPGLVLRVWEKDRKAFLAEMGISEPVKAPAQKDQSKKPAENRGTPQKQQNGSNAQLTDEQKEAEYQKELRARLAGTWPE